MFTSYLNLGIDHILDINGYDHVLFVISICLLANFKAWRKLLFLISAFTLGHCITLILSSLNLISIPADLIEKIIPVTIFLSALDNIIQRDKVKSFNPKYLIVLIFGLIHGLGFSNFFKAIIGKEESIVTSLLAFNIGVEIAQLAIIACTLLSIFILGKLGINQHIVNLIVSLIIMGLALIMIF